MKLASSLPIGFNSPLAPAPLKSAFERYVSKLARLLGMFETYRSVMAELAKLDDRELTDLNISRADFHTIALESARKA